MDVHPTKNGINRNWSIPNWICPESSISRITQRDLLMTFTSSSKDGPYKRDLLSWVPHFWTVAVTHFLRHLPMFHGTLADDHQLIGSIASLKCICSLSWKMSSNVTSARKQRYNTARATAWGSFRRLMGWIDKMFHVVWDTIFEQPLSSVMKTFTTWKHCALMITPLHREQSTSQHNTK